MKKLILTFVSILFLQSIFAQEDFVIQTQTEFPGGKDSLAAFLMNNIRYPAEARVNNQTGTVYISFIVDTIGNLSRIKVDQGVCASLDSEAVSVVRKMPNWKPATMNGKKVLGRHVLPIKYEIATIKKDDPDYGKIFTIVEEIPQFPGGDAELLKYIKSHTEYPSDAKEKNIHGTVYVTFVIRDNGKVTDVKILRGVYPSIDEQAVSIVKSMPDWIPGRQNGYAVSVQFNLPINY